jgi:hypothetical protein
VRIRLRTGQLTSFKWKQHNPKGLPGAASTSQLDSTVACSVREHPLHSILSNAQESTYGNTLSNIACVETSRVFGTVA